MITQEQRKEWSRRGGLAKRKLSDEQVAEICNSDLLIRNLAKKYKVSRATITRARRKCREN